MTALVIENKATVAAWTAMLNNTALLATPGVHHNLVTKRAGELHSLQIVSPEEFS